MGLFSRLAGRVPRGVAIFVMGFSGIFGIRTPPDPEVVAQTAPRPNAAGNDPRDSRTRTAPLRVSPEEEAERG